MRIRGMRGVWRWIAGLWWVLFGGFGELRLIWRLRVDGEREDVYILQTGDFENIVDTMNVACC